ncbi:MAG: response regulator [Oscillospiraceae bacterium]
MNIVIVDNNPDDLAQLGEMVAEILPGCQIQSFTDPLLSAKYICNIPVDMVILSDVMRPASGFRLMRVLRKNIPKLPIVMLSASGVNEAEALAAEVNGFLTNPISTERLSSVIHGALLE